MKTSAKKLLEDEFYDIPYKVRKKYKDTSTVQLLEELESLTIRNDIEEDRYVEESYTDYDKAKEIELMICHRLDLFKGYHLLQIIRILNSDTENKIKELEEKFLNHRHCLDKTYGEKPVW